MKSGPQLGQVSPRQPSAHGVGEGQPPRAPVLLHTPGPPVPWGPGPAPPALTLLPTAPSPSARDGVGLACPWDDRPLSAPPSCPRASSLSLTLQGCGAQLTSPLGLLAPASLSDAPVLLASPLALQLRRHRRPGLNPWVGKTPWRREWQPTPVSLPGESCGQRILAGYSPWSCKESDMTE